ncbi:MAG: ABC transporter ATP-binding protein, partial [Acetobacteraceae bacterium]|nr:ABC transporter ATP-binding protein [Acetobacteraceae bacterium]
NMALAVIAQKVAEALRLVRLEGLGERLPRQLSGGQQQRVAFARAVVFDPSLLLMDEPLGALDKNLREQMQFELKQLHARLGVTVIYVTHDQEEALTMSDRVALMNRGRIAQIGPAEALYERPATRFVAAFVGESNIIEGRAEGARFRCRAGPCFPLPPGAGHGSAIAIRPEKFTFAGTAAPQAVPGRIAELVYVGDFTRYRVELANGLLVTVKVQNGPQAVRQAPGEQVGLLVDAEHVRLLGAEDEVGS